MIPTSVLPHNDPYIYPIMLFHYRLYLPSLHLSHNVVSLQVVGEYAYVQEDLDTADVLEKITALINRRFEEPDTHGWVVTAITKLVSHLGHMPESVQSQIALYLTSTDTDIQQVRACTSSV